MSILSGVDVILVRPAVISLLWSVALLLSSVLSWVDVVVIAPTLVLSDWLRSGLIVLVARPVKVVQTEVVLLGLRLLLSLVSSTKVGLIVELFLGLLLT